MKQSISILLVSCVMLLIASCSKSSMTGDNSPTYLQMINTYYGQSFNLEVGGKNLLSNIAFDSISPFAGGAPGFYSLNVINYASGDTVITGNINLQSGLHYSMFLVPDSTQGSNSVLYSLTSSTWVRPLYDSIRIQFLNYAYNLPPISFCLVPQTGNTMTDTIGIRSYQSAIYQSRTYMDINSTPALAQFQTIPINRYQIIFYANIGASYSPKTIVDTTVSLLDKQKLYTIYMEGNYADSAGDNPMKVRFIEQ